MSGTSLSEPLFPPQAPLYPTVPEARIDELQALFAAATARLRSAEAKMDELRITAPFAGTVGLRQVSLGNLVQPGATITTLDDVSRIKLDFAVPEVFLGKLAMGLPVAARSAAYPKRVFNGIVTAIDTRVDPVSRAIRINAEFDNREGSLRPGMFLTVRLAIDRREGAVLVSEEALVPDGEEQFVFLARGGKATKVRVRIGQRLDGRVEIVEGLRAGDEVVVRGTQKVRDGGLIQISPPDRTS